MNSLLSVNEDDVSFEILFHQNPRPMWIVDATTLEFLMVNQAAVTHYGYSYKEFLSITLARIRPADEQKSMRRLIKRIKHNQTIKTNIRHVKKNGDYIYVQITSYNVLYHHRECRMVVINDVTQVFLKDQEITSMLKRLYQTLDSITDGFITINKKWKITYWNKEAERFFGFTKDRRFNKTILRAYAVGADSILSEKFKNALTTGQTEKFEVFLPAATKWLDVSIYPDTDGLTVYFQDITTLKSNQATINQKDKNLEEIAYINSHTIRKHIANIIGVVNTVGNDLDNCEDLITPMRMLKASAEELDMAVRLVNWKAEPAKK